MVPVVETITNGITAVTKCYQNAISFSSLDRRQIAASFTGGEITSNAGFLLLREIIQKTGLAKKASVCLNDNRRQASVQHQTETLLTQRLMAICAGYEDLNDHDRLKLDKALQVGCNQTDIWPALRPCADWSASRIAQPPFACMNCSLISSSRATRSPQNPLSLTSMRPTFPFTENRNSASFMVTTIITAFYRFMCSAAGIYWSVTCVTPVRMPPNMPGQSSLCWSRKSDVAGLTCSSHSGVTVVFVVIACWIGVTATTYDTSSALPVTQSLKRKSKAQWDCWNRFANPPV